MKQPSWNAGFGIMARAFICLCLCVWLIAGMAPSAAWALPGIPPIGGLPGNIPIPPITLPPGVSPPGGLLPPGIGDAVEGNCTNTPAFAIPSEGRGIVSAVAEEITSILDGGARKMFESVLGSGAFRAAVNGTLVLFVAIYGIMITTGIINMTGSDGAVRLVKIGVITALLNEGWGFFYKYVGGLFIGGTDDLVNLMTSIAVGATASSGDATRPLYVLDRTLALLFSGKMMPNLSGTAMSGPYGPIIALMVLIGVIFCMLALFRAVWVYLLSKVAMMLLFGLAPIFMVCLLFQRTKNLFDGWLSQLVSYSLQPIMLFAFFGFYSVLIQSSLTEILKVDFCWVSRPNVVSGLPFDPHYWAPMISGTPFTGTFDWRNVPFNVVEILVFVLLSYVAWRYAGEVVNIAREIAGGGVLFPQFGGALTSWFQNTASRAGTRVKDTVIGDGGGGGGSGGTSPPWANLVRGRTGPK